MQPLRSYWLHSCRLQGPPRAPHSTLLAFSACLCHDPSRECWHDGHYYNWSQAEHTNVFLPRQPLLHRSRLFICYCTQGYEQLLVCEQVHLLCRLCDPALSLHPLHCDRGVYPGNHGLWLLHCHLQSSPLHCPDVNTSLCSVGGWFLFFWLYQLTSSDQQDICFILLCFSGHWSFLLWHRPLQRLSCSDLFILRMFSFTLSGLIIFPTIIVIIVSYLYIVSTVLKIPSTERG